MEFSYPEESKSSSSEETDRSEQNDHDTGTGSCRSYECVFCKRGFTTAQALGGHMNIHRKDRAKTKPLHFPAAPSTSSTSTKLFDHDNHYSTHLGFYSAISTHPGSYYSTAPEVDSNNYRPIYFAAPSNMQYGEVFCAQNQRDRDPYEQDHWRRSLYSNHPLCVRDNKDTAEDNGEEDGLDLELRLGHHP